MSSPARTLPQTTAQTSALTPALTFDRRPAAADLAPGCAVQGSRPRWVR